MSQAKLITERRFLPFFLTQFFGAFNDNVYKNALVLLFAVRPPADVPLTIDEMSNYSAGLLMLPYFLFSSTAGQLADKYEKSSLIRATKIMEIVIMAVACIGFFTHSGILLLSLVFLLGIQATLFGPVKFAILPQVLKEDELVGGNGLVEMGTYVAILGGMITGTVLIGMGTIGEEAASAGIVLFAVLGYLSARAIPIAPAASPDLKIDWNPVRTTIQTLRYGMETRAVWLSILGNSWFWFYGSLVLAQFPGFTKNVLGGSEGVITLLLALFAIGVGVGSLLCEKLSSGHIELGLVPFGAFGLTLFGFDLYFTSSAIQLPVHEMGVLEFIESPTHWHVIADLVLLGLFGGFYSVPLYAIMQNRSAVEHRSRVIAANNIVNALFMVASAILAVVLLKLGVTIPQLFLITAIGNALVAIYIFTLLPEFLMRFLIWMLMNTMYRLKTVDIERIPKEGPAVLVCNHISYVDALILAAASHRPIRFVMYYLIFKIPVLNFVFRTSRAIPIASRKADAKLMERAFEQIAEALENGELVCIFPEGMLTYTGEMNPFKPGIERILEKTPVPVIPMALRGLWGSFFSRRGGPAMSKRPRRFWSRVELVVGEPIAPSAESPVTAESLEKTVLALRGDWK